MERIVRVDEGNIGLKLDRFGEEGAGDSTSDDDDLLPQSPPEALHGAGALRGPSPGNWDQGTRIVRDRREP